jgi:cytochrome c
MQKHTSLLVLVLASVSLAATAHAQTAVQRGEALVKQHCAACHGMGAAGESPTAKAPPLVEVARKYRPEDLEEAFAEGIMVSHQGTDMPPFTFDPPQIDALTAYLRSLRAARR